MGISFIFIFDVGLLLSSSWKVVVLFVIRLVGWVIGCSFRFMLVGVSVFLFGLLVVMKVFMWLFIWVIFRLVVLVGIFLVRVLVVLC